MIYRLILRIRNIFYRHKKRTWKEANRFRKKWKRKQNINNNKDINNSMLKWICNNNKKAI